MIYVEMFGRLGNQFFRYVAARALQLSQFPQDKLILSFNQINDAHVKDLTFYNVLPDYNVPDYDIWNRKGKVIFKESNLKQKMICIPYYMGIRKIPPESMNEEMRYENRWSNILRKNGIYWFRRGYYPFVPSEADNKFISGNFEDPRYFESIGNVLRREFTPKHEPLAKNNELYRKIRETQSVCISVRRGDFETNSQFKALQSVCHKEYFTQAVEIIKHQVDHPVFFLFSDDVKWAKENVITECETYCEDGTDPVWEKLRMMSLCKHYVISNSTFSWWAQWLSTNENKIVISPSHWFNNNYQSPLIDQNWIKIKV